MKRLAFVLISPFLLAACDDSPTSNESGAPPPEAMVSSFVSMSAGPDGTYPCDEGGEVERSGELSTVIGEGTITTTWHFTVIHRGCTIRVEQLVLTTDGSIVLDGVDRREYDGVAVGALLENTVRQTGSLRWRTNEGYDRTCVIDITITADPATNVRRLTGTLCGNPVDIEVTLP